MPGIEVVVQQRDDDAMTSLGDFSVGTDSAGRFTIVNVPANDGYWIFGSARSCGERGSLPARPLQVGAPGTSTDAGVLALEPGVRVSGRVVTSDQGKLPPDTQLCLVREDVQEAMPFPVAADGSFVLLHAPRELVSLAPLLETYRVSPANASYDFVNHVGLLGRLEGDVELELVLEPVLGDEENALPDVETWKRYEQLMKAPLRGRVAEASQKR